MALGHIHINTDAISKKSPQRAENRYHYQPLVEFVFARLFWLDLFSILGNNS